MCAGRWVISRVFILGRKRRSFISVSLIRRSFFHWFLLFFCVCFSFSSLILQMFSTHLCGRTFRQLLLRVRMFYSHLRILSQMWLWLAELPVLDPSIPLPTTDGSLGRVIMAWQLFPHLLFTLFFICIIGWGEDSVPSGVRRSQHCLDASVGGRAVSYGSSVGDKYSFWCVAFNVPPHIQEGANQCLPTRTISCL